MQVISVGAFSHHKLIHKFLEVVYMSLNDLSATNVNTSVLFCNDIVHANYAASLVSETTCYLAFSLSICISTLVSCLCGDGEGGGSIDTCNRSTLTMSFSSTFSQMANRVRVERRRIMNATNSSSLLPRPRWGGCVAYIPLNVADRMRNTIIHCVISWNTRMKYAFGGWSEIIWSFVHLLYLWTSIYLFEPDFQVYHYPCS